MEMDYLEDYVDFVAAKITKKEKLKKTISYYKIADRLRDIGIRVTQAGLLNYKKASTESMSWPVTAGLAVLGELTDEEVMRFIKRSIPKR